MNSPNTSALNTWLPQYPQQGFFWEIQPKYLSLDTEAMTVSGYQKPRDWDKGGYSVEETDSGSLQSPRLSPKIATVQ